MRNIFISGFTVLILLFSGSATLVNAQDTVKKAPAIKKPIVNPTTTVKPPAIDPVTGKPINPRTGRPYTKYGYGYYSKAARTADSLKKAAVLKTVTTTVAVTPPPPIADTTHHIAAPVDKSLNGQYQYLLTKVYNYQQPLVSALWKNVNDSLSANRRKLSDLQAKLTAQTKATSDLQAAKDAAAVTSTSDDIDLFGMTLSKNMYSLIMWGLVIVLGATAGIVIARSGKFKYEADYRIKLYNELEEEFKTYKSKANEKEKKLARELQTERNKLDELLGRG